MANSIEGGRTSEILQQINCPPLVDFFVSQTDVKSWEAVRSSMKPDGIAGNAKEEDVSASMVLRRLDDNTVRLEIYPWDLASVKNRLPVATLNYYEKEFESNFNRQRLEAPMIRIKLDGITVLYKGRQSNSESWLLRTLADFSESLPKENKE